MKSIRRNSLIDAFLNSRRDEIFIGTAIPSSFLKPFMGGRKYFAPLELGNQSDDGTINIPPLTGSNK
jgi:hypothetical protein